MIYKYLLVSDEPLNPHNYYHFTQIRSLAIAACASKQSKTEAESILWGLNTFSFYALDMMGDFLGSIGKTRRDLIRSINVKYDASIARVPGLTLLADCAGLEKLKIGLGVGALSGARQQNRLFGITGLKTLMKVRGCKDLTIEPSQWIMERYGPAGNNQSQEFEGRLRRELCKEREVGT